MFKNRHGRRNHTATSDLGVLVRVVFHPHPGQVDVGQSDRQLETFWTYDFSWQNAHHGFTVGLLEDHVQRKISDPGVG